MYFTITFAPFGETSLVFLPSTFTDILLIFEVNALSSPGFIPISTETVYSPFSLKTPSSGDHLTLSTRVLAVSGKDAVNEGAFPASGASIVKLIIEMMPVANAENGIMLIIIQTVKIPPISFFNVVFMLFPPHIQP